MGIVPKAANDQHGPVTGKSVTASECRWKIGKIAFSYSRWCTDEWAEPLQAFSFKLCLNSEIFVQVTVSAIDCSLRFSSCYQGVLSFRDSSLSCRNTFLARVTSAHPIFSQEGYRLKILAGVTTARKNRWPQARLRNTRERKTTAVGWTPWAVPRSPDSRADYVITRTTVDYKFVTWKAADARLTVLHQTIILCWQTAVPLTTSIVSIIHNSFKGISQSRFA